MSEKPPEYVDDAAAAGGRESSNITKLSHIAIAVRDADALVDTFVNPPNRRVFARQRP